MAQLREARWYGRRWLPYTFRGSPYLLPESPCCCGTKIVICKQSHMQSRTITIADTLLILKLICVRLLLFLRCAGRVLASLFFMQFLRWINALTAVLYNYAQNVLIFPPFCIEFKSPTYRAFPVFLAPCFPWPPFYVSSWVLCMINMYKGDNCLWVSLEPHHISSSIHPSVVTVSPLKRDKIIGQKTSWGQRFPCRASLML